MEGIQNKERVPPIVFVEENLSELQKKSKGTRLYKDFLIKNENKEIVGNFTLSIARPPGKEATAYLATINVHAARGKGYGRAAYLKIIDLMHRENIRFTSSETMLSRDSKKVWDWLVAQGKARVIDPGEVFETAENVGYSTTQYEAI